MNRYRLEAIALTLLLLPDSRAEADWAAYTSDNFTILSDARRGAAVEVLENFEIFRRITLAMLDLPDEAESQRLRIVMYQRPRDFDRIKPEENVGGFFYHSVFGPRMIVGPQWGLEGSQYVLFHEYVHYLMNKHSATNYPRWYSEGLAELLAYIDMSGSPIVVGGFHTSSRSRATVGDLVAGEFEVDSDFYYTAWLMTHYFLIDSLQDPTRKRQTIEYVRRYDAGEDPFQAFAESYGISPEEMQEEIAAYSRRARFNAIEFPSVEYTGEIASRDLEPGEDLYLLGDIAVELNEYEAAYAYFDEFEELRSGSPLAAKIGSRRAIGYVHEERVAEGDALIEDLIASNPSDADVLADIAHYAFDRHNLARNNAEDTSVDHLKRSIEFGRRAVAENAEDLEALYYLGLAHELDGDLQTAADTLLLSYDINPSVPPLNLSLARVLLKGRQAELASYLLARVYSASHSDETRARIRDIQRRIEDGSIDVAAIDGLL